MIVREDRNAAAVLAGFYALGCILQGVEVDPLDCANTAARILGAISRHHPGTRSRDVPTDEVSINPRKKR